VLFAIAVQATGARVGADFVGGYGGLDYCIGAGVR